MLGELFVTLDCFHYALFLCIVLDHEYVERVVQLGAKTFLLLDDNLDLFNPNIIAPLDAIVERLVVAPLLGHVVLDGYSSRKLRSVKIEGRL